MISFDLKIRTVDSDLAVDQPSAATVDAQAFTADVRSGGQASTEGGGVGPHIMFITVSVPYIKVCVVLAAGAAGIAVNTVGNAVG